MLSQKSNHTEVLSVVHAGVARVKSEKFWVAMPQLQIRLACLPDQPFPISGLCEVAS